MVEDTVRVGMVQVDGRGKSPVQRAWMHATAWSSIERTSVMGGLLVIFRRREFARVRHLGPHVLTAIATRYGYPVLTYRRISPRPPEVCSNVIGKSASVPLSFDSEEGVVVRRPRESAESQEVRR